MLKEREVRDGMIVYGVKPKKKERRVIEYESVESRHRPRRQLAAIFITELLELTETWELSK